MLKKKKDSQEVDEGCAERRWNGETEATQSLAYVVLKSAISNNSLIYTAIPQKGLACKGPKPPKYPSNLSCQNSRKPLHQEDSVLPFWRQGKVSFFSGRDRKLGIL